MRDAPVLRFAGNLRGGDAEAEQARVYVLERLLDYGGAEEAFEDVGACLFCFGVSATQVSGEAEYRRVTHGSPPRGR